MTDSSFQSVQSTSTSTENTMLAHRGFLPSPEILLQYEKVQPGFAERLLTITEKEQNKRLAREDRKQILEEKELNTERLQIIVGFLGICVVIGFCSYLAYLQQAIVAGSVASSVLIGLAYVFVSRRFPKTNKNDNSVVTNTP
ncbi:DUF2335 domain-containing protein [Arcicella aquatica]|uniref:DUF2335 domain-containing protein n=1 Tax=Arcicella aquatica TaxID=217141 RepID=A0ABU5QSJ8_9BACT|nr:DUF2335 domain-containing protein [Arcicella aquatica]MEA5260083.1 DUF2335 domain-containing protein [Arcicella aquatica]